MSNIFWEPYSFHNYLVYRRAPRLVGTQLRRNSVCEYLCLKPWIIFCPVGGPILQCNSPFMIFLPFPLLDWFRRKPDRFNQFCPLTAPDISLNEIHFRIRPGYHIQPSFLLPIVWFGVGFQNNPQILRVTKMDKPRDRKKKKIDKPDPKLPHWFGSDTANTFSWSCVHHMKMS